MIYGDRTTTFDDFLKKNNDEYINVIKQLSVDIDIKNGIGETI